MAPLTDFIQSVFSELSMELQISSTTQATSLLSRALLQGYSNLLQALVACVLEGGLIEMTVLI